MVFFRKKPPEERPEEIKEVKRPPKETPKPPVAERPKLPELPPPHPEEEKVAKKQFAPLFVKIERYKSVLSLMNDLKSTIFMLKNALEIQRQLEGLKDANQSVIESGIQKFEQKIAALDSEFTRPPGYEEEHIPMGHQTDLDMALDDLKKRIDDLKSDLKGVA